MNWKLINRVFRELSLHPDQKKFINCVRFHPNESTAHRKMKYELANEDYDKGIPFLQEAWTEDRVRRFDHISFTDNPHEWVVEIETTSVIKPDADKIIRIDRRDL